MSTDDQTTEQMIQDKGKTAARIVPNDIKMCVRGAQYYVFPGTMMTVCALTLKNSFVVTGEAACASPENYDKEIGEKIARERAEQKIWALEGYLLKQRLFEGETKTSK